MEQVIRDSQFVTQGYFQTNPDGTVKVYGKDRAYLGKATKGGTYDKYGVRISPDPVPGLLLPPPARGRGK
jgi:hypothetical protein